MLLSAALALSPCAGVYAQDLQGMDDSNEILDVQEIPEEQKIPEEQVEQLPGELNSEVTVPESVSEGNVEALEEAGTNEAAAESVFDIQDGVLVKYTGSDRKVVIPEGVTRIGDSAFLSCTLKNVEFPETLESIGDWAFGYCNLEKVVIPKKVNHVGKGAFNRCRKSVI